MPKKQQHKGDCRSGRACFLCCFSTVIYFINLFRDADSFSLLLNSKASRGLKGNTAANFIRFFKGAPHSRNSIITTTLLLSDDSFGVDEKKSSSVKKPFSVGVYSRPSAAIERGSGFYIPGLEGSRVRSLFGMLVLVLCYTNHVSAAVHYVSFSLILSEIITCLFGILLFLQGLIELGKESGFALKFDRADVFTKEYNIAPSSQVTLWQLSSFALSDTFFEALQWIAGSLVSLTPATHVMLIEGMLPVEQHSPSSSSVLFLLGDFPPDDSITQEKKKEQLKAAINAVMKSKGGRISIPATHPAAELLPSDYRRCVLLQRSEKDSTEPTRLRCFLIGSNQLLANFTRNDLKWLGSLAKYSQLEM